MKNYLKDKFTQSYLFGTLRRHIRRVWSSRGSYFGEFGRTVVRILASLAEPWFVFWRVWSSRGSYFGEFGRAVVRILARLVEPWFVFWRVWPSRGSYFGEFGRAKIPIARPNEPDMPPKRTKKVRLGIYRSQIQPKIR